MSELTAFRDSISDELKSVVDGLIKLVDASSVPIQLDWRRGGFELRLASFDGKPAGRPRIFVFRESKKKVHAFFYKPSRLSFSKDRFSYGLLGLHRGSIDDALAIFAEGLDYIRSDFRPSLRPKKLPRTVNVTVPRD